MNTAIASYPDWLKPVPWETRNIGVECFAIAGDAFRDNTVDALASVLDDLAQKHGRIFVQARLEHIDTHTSSCLEHAGFYFVESTLDPHSLLAANRVFQDFLQNKAAVLPRKFAAEQLLVSLLERTSQNQISAVHAIARESFVADRFHVDWQCPPGIANERFVKWVDDLLADSAVAFQILHHGISPIGFFAHKAEQLILAGFSRAYANSGLGDYYWLSVLENLCCSGCTAVHSRISVNNAAVLNLYARIGFKFRNPAVVFHYWRSATNFPVS